MWRKCAPQYIDEIKYIIDEIENGDDRNGVFCSRYLTSRLAMKCNNDRANKYQNWLATLDESYSKGELGVISNQELSSLVSSTVNSRINEINYNNYGSRIKIIEYINSKNVLIEFDNGYKAKCEYGNFKKGSIKSPYCKSVYKKGYIGEGKYLTWEKNEHTIQYKIWFQMLRRCYSEKALIKNPTYKECSVCDEWLNFQNFAKWFDENYYKIYDEVMCLDKDILVKGNRLYSPETCVFVPSRINSLFTRRQNNRGNYPIGVMFEKETNKFLSYCNNENNNIVKLGRFKTKEEAFYKYKEFKEKIIKIIANKYKEFIPNKLYCSMYTYTVDIND